MSERSDDGDPPEEPPVDTSASTGIEDPLAEEVLADEDDDEPSDFVKGLASSQGDPKVLFVLNVILSTIFASTLVAALSFVGIIEYSVTNVGLTAAFFVVVTAFMIHS